MQTSKTGRRTLLWLVVVLLLFIGISYMFVPDTPEEYPGFVSESPSPTGVKAFYTYMDDQFGAVNRWDRSPEQLTEKGGNQLLMMIGPSFTPNSKEMDEYISFLESGNTILLMKENPDGMFGVETVPVQGDETGSITDQDGDGYQADLRSAFRIDPATHDNVLVYDNAGAIAVESTFGKGRLITSTAPEWMTNESILEQDHLELVLSLTQTTEWDTVYFDEYMHGSGNAPAITTLYPDWLLVLAFQAILLTTLWLMFKGKRFGSVIKPREETVRFSDERIQALAAWYQRGNRYRDALRLQADYLKRLLQERWGIPYYKDWPDIHEQLERKTAAGPEMETFIDELANVLHQDHVSKKTYLSWSKRIDRLRKEVEEG
ncbi:DUF4350 domain-containing protein [Lentibacillus salicampi]|uniref:DUF4350 domain-containing protein n=1 Tax=Lentibacillus salicampi TaxID=175306 RepID=UPI001FD7DD99|nr:DUF4350 domain-containing protein [Lentibacillus salicampi]